MIKLVVEEFERGSWIADLDDVEPYTGTFLIGSTTWVGKAVGTTTEGERQRTRIVGGAGGLAKVIPDRYYDGSVSLGAAVQEICTNGAELFGSATPGVMLQTYERLRDTVAGALDRLADENQMIWWVDRDGSLHMAATRPPAGLADGVRVDPQTDGSVTLVNPEGVVLGATYQGKPIRHIRWTMTADRQQAQIYFVPFLFPTPQKQTIYSCHYSAKVDTDNGDGTIDVIADGRFGVTKVPLMSGIPGSKITVKPGELVTLGFLGGNPRAPYAIAHGQISSAQKLVARKTDPITQGTLQFTYVPGSGPGVIVPGVLSITYTPGNGGPPQVLPLGSGTLTIGENIDGGSERVALDDG